MRSLKAIVPVFSITLFLSAFLLFWVEPMFGKMMLPLLGGSPAVWITAMLFYQLTLLTGYSYAHATSYWLTLLQQAFLHLVLLAAALFTLPIAIPSGWIPPAGNPIGWMLFLMATALGMPFILLSATTPIIQRWFASTNHPRASNPYFLYAVSNIGSVLGLFAYPLFIEPQLKLTMQSQLWSAGFTALALFVAYSALLVLRYQAKNSTQPVNLVSAKTTAAVRHGRLLYWVALAFIPSSLMLSVTTFITTDIAAIPLMWVIPLFLYLLTFIIAFSRKPLISSRAALWAQPFFIVPLCIALVFITGRTGVSSLWFLPLHLGAFFFSALVCHAELVRVQPPASHLTKYFLAISAGGALGGIINVLVAPFVFNDVYEYPIGLVLACLLRPWPPQGVWQRKGWIIAVLATVVLIGIAEAIPGHNDEHAVTAVAAFKSLLAIAAICLFATRQHPLWFAGSVGLYLTIGIAGNVSHEMLDAERNFFGVVRVRDIAENNIRILEHGTTVHGMQALDDAHRLVPLSYYSRFGGLGEALTALAAIKTDAQIGVIGLGAGSLVCYGQPHWHYSFFEIDPIVAKVASDPRSFSFLNDCGHSSDILLGDGRLSIKKMPDGYFDAIVLDAFSSDVIPLHLLTQEAMRLYVAKLTPNGMIILHISNRYFNLVPVVAAMARDLGLAALVRLAPAGQIEGTKLPYFASLVMAVARKPDDFRGLAQMPDWKTAKAAPNVKSWTDDYSNLLQALIH